MLTIVEVGGCAYDAPPAAAPQPTAPEVRREPQLTGDELEQAIEKSGRERARKQAEARKRAAERDRQREEANDAQDAAESAAERAERQKKAATSQQAVDSAVYGLKRGDPNDPTDRGEPAYTETSKGSLERKADDAEKSP